MRVGDIPMGFTRPDAFALTFTDRYTAGVGAWMVYLSVLVVVWLEWYGVDSVGLE